MELIGRTRITRLSAKKNIAYPMLRFPKEYGDYIGKYARIYRIDSSHFLVEIENVEEYKTVEKGFKPTGDTEEGENNVHENPEKSRKTKGMRGLGFEPRNPYGTGPSSQRLWPSSTTPAL